jgi:hypothetical protein
MEALITVLTHQVPMIFPKYRRTPIFDPERKRCAVCRQPVYSLAGIHPQCAIKRALALESRSKREAASKARSPVVVVALRAGTALKATSESTSHAERIFPFDRCKLDTHPQTSR